MTQARVRAALETVLETWATAQSMLVAWENVTFDPGTQYVRSNLLPAQTQSFDLLGLHRRYQGVYQVTLVMPQGVGMGATEALVASLEVSFPQHTYFVSGGLRVLISRPMSAAGSFTGDGEVSVPVSCTYQADTIVS